MTFLVVDDSKVARKKLSSYIVELGYTVIGEAENGIEACQKAKELKPKYITMDIEMPEMNGVEATKEISSFDSSIDILVITATINKKELTNILRNGAKKILCKPVSKKMFEEALDELIYGHLNLRS